MKRPEVKLSKFLALLFLLVLLADLYCHVQPQPAQAAMQEQERQQLMLTAERARTENERAMALLETCFGKQVHLDRVQSVDVTLTAYSSTVDQCDSTPHHTASSETVRPGIIAVSDDLVKELGLTFGQKVLIPGHGIFEVQDRMHPRWRRTVDIWISDRKAALLFGKRRGTLLWIGAGETTVSKAETGENGRTS